MGWKDSNLGKRVSKKMTFPILINKYNDLIIRYFDMAEHCMTLAPRHDHATVFRCYAYAAAILVISSFLGIGKKERESNFKSNFFF